MKIAVAVMLGRWMAASSIQEKTKPFQEVFIALNAEAIL